MAISMEDMNAIKSELDDRYVMQTDCNDIQANNSKKFAYDDKRIEKQEEFIGGLKKFGWAIISVLIGEVVVSLITLLKDFA